MLRLGRLEIKNPYLLAPMQMYSDIAFRELCYEYGCSYSISELMSAKDLLNLKLNPKKIDFLEDKTNIGLQLLTNNPTEISKTIQHIKSGFFDKTYRSICNISSINLNLGCPDPDVINSGMGSALLKEPKIVRELFRTLVKDIGLPVSAKMRLALNSKHKKTKPYLRIAKIAEEEGLDFIIVHARSAGQGYEGEIDLAALQEICEEVKLPVVGNGNIIDKTSADSMLEICDAVMIGRKALEAPYFFKELTDRKWKVEPEREKILCLQKYLKNAKRYSVGFQQVKIHTQSFIKGTRYENLIQKMTKMRDTSELSKITEKIALN